MDGHDGRRARCDERFDLGRVKREGIWLDVAEDGCAVVPVDGVRRRHKSEWRGDDLARDAQCQPSHQQGNHAIGEERDDLHAWALRHIVHINHSAI